MRSYPSVAPLICGFASAVFLAGFVFLSPEFAIAQDSGASPDKGTTSPCGCPTQKPDTQKLWPRPKLADTRPGLDAGDEMATLEALQLALSEVGDGSTYVWHRRGVLSGAVLPTASFKDASGKVCRHLILTLSAGDVTRQTEGVACRLPTGVWQLEG